MVSVTMKSFSRAQPPGEKLAKRGSDGDGGSREQEGSGRQAEAKDAIAVLGRRGEGAEEFDWTKHQE